MLRNYLIRTIVRASFNFYVSEEGRFAEGSLGLLKGQHI